MHSTTLAVLSINGFVPSLGYSFCPDLTGWLRMRGTNTRSHDCATTQPAMVLHSSKWLASTIFMLRHVGGGHLPVLLSSSKRFYLTTRISHEHGSSLVDDPKSWCCLPSWHNKPKSRLEPLCIAQTCTESLPVLISVLVVKVVFGVSHVWVGRFIRAKQYLGTIQSLLCYNDDSMTGMTSASLDTESRIEIMISHEKLIHIRRLQPSCP